MYGGNPGMAAPMPMMGAGMHGGMMPRSSHGARAFPKSKTLLFRKCTPGILGDQRFDAFDDYGVRNEMTDDNVEILATALDCCYLGTQDDVKSGNAVMAVFPTPIQRELGKSRMEELMEVLPANAPAKLWKACMNDIKLRCAEHQFKVVSQKMIVAKRLREIKKRVAERQRAKIRSMEIYEAGAESDSSGGFLKQNEDDQQNVRMEPAEPGVRGRERHTLNDLVGIRVRGKFQGLEGDRHDGTIVSGNIQDVEAEVQVKVDGVAAETPLQSIKFTELRPWLEAVYSAEIVDMKLRQGTLRVHEICTPARPARQRPLRD